MAEDKMKNITFLCGSLISLFVLKSLNDFPTDPGHLIKFYLNVKLDAYLNIKKGDILLG